MQGSQSKYIAIAHAVLSTMKMIVQRTAGSYAFKYLGTRSITRTQPDPSRLHHCGLGSARHFRLLAARDRQRLPTHARQARPLQAGSLLQASWQQV